MQTAAWGASGWVLWLCVAVAGDPPAAADPAPELAAYREAGVPDLNHPWNGPDFLKASETLRGLCEADPTKLPRRDSPHAGPLFKQLVAVIGPLVKSRAALSPRERCDDIKAQFQGLLVLCDLYVGALSTGTKCAAEVVEVELAFLKVSSRLLQATEEWVASEEKLKDQPEGATVLSAMRAALVGFFQGQIIVFALPGVFATADLKRWATGWGDVLPEMLRRFAPADRAKFTAAFAQLEAEPSLEAVRPELQRVSALLKSAEPGK